MINQRIPWDTYIGRDKNDKKNTLYRFIINTISFHSHMLLFQASNQLQILRQFSSKHTHANFRSLSLNKSRSPWYFMVLWRIYSTLSTRCKYKGVLTNKTRYEVDLINGTRKECHANNIPGIILTHSNMVTKITIQLFVEIRLQSRMHYTSAPWIFK